MGRLLGDITQPNVISRYLNLAVSIEGVIDSAIHADKKLLEGTLMGVQANGKLRAYFESEVSVTFDTANVDFTLSEIAGQALMKQLRIGDVVEGIDGTALGTVLSFDPVTGVGTLAAVSTTTYAGNVRVAAADLVITGNSGRVLKDEVLLDSADEPIAVYYEGFFSTQMVLGATPKALTDLGAKVISSSEFRLI